MPTLRFADRLDGFAFVTGIGVRQLASARAWDVLAFATGGGNIYAVTAHCSLQRCTDYRFERSPVWIRAGVAGGRGRSGRR